MILKALRSSYKVVHVAVTKKQFTSETQWRLIPDKSSPANHVLLFFQIYIGDQEINFQK